MSNEHQKCENFKIQDSNAMKSFIECHNIKSVLLGNGFSLSHPELNDCFKWDLHEALCHCWHDIMPRTSTNCPEKDLNRIRQSIIKKSLLFYIKKLNKILAAGDKADISIGKLYKNYNPTCALLKDNRFTNIFTLNYDPLLYWEVLKNLEKDGHKKYCDGFNGDKFIDQNNVKGNFTCNKKDKKYTNVYYLHGSWFIQCNLKNEVRKLSFSNKSPIVILDDLFTEDVCPFLILEDRWHTKKALIDSKEDAYLHYCYEQLELIEGKLLIFGCSFNNDDHILQALKLNIKRKHGLQKIFATYPEGKNDEKEYLKQKLEKFDLKVDFVSVADNVIWESTNPKHTPKI